MRCESRSALGYAFLAWRERLEADTRDEIADSLQAFFCRPGVRERVIEKIREALANDHAPVRLAAMETLESIGTLDDIGLLSDLLALPPLDDEDPGERGALE